MAIKYIQTCLIKLKCQHTLAHRIALVKLIISLMLHIISICVSRVQSDALLPERESCSVSLCVGKSPEQRLFRRMVPLRFSYHYTKHFK